MQYLQFEILQTGQGGIVQFQDIHELKELDAISASGLQRRI